MRGLLSLEATRQTPLLKGPYISLSRAFRTGSSVRGLVQEGALHPFMENLVSHPHLYGHQERAIRSIVSGKTTPRFDRDGLGQDGVFSLPRDSGALSSI
ncbi:MAG: hypothetical protein ACRD21_16270 [Vicinamibacteria bacterium]